GFPEKTAPVCGTHREKRTPGAAKAQGEENRGGKAGIETSRPETEEGETGGAGTAPTAGAGRPFLPYHWPHLRGRALRRDLGGDGAGAMGRTGVRGICV